MVELAGVAFQVFFDLPQPSRPAKLPQQQRDQVRLARHAPLVRIGLVSFHKLVESSPRNLLQQVMQNDILVTHGVDPLAVQMIRNPLNSSRINVVHFLKQKSCRTAVGLTRQSISLSKALPKKMDTRVKPAYDELNKIKGRDAAC